MRLLRLLNEAGFPQDKAQGQDAEHLHVLSRLQEAPRPIFHRFGGDTNFVKKALPFGALFSLHEDSFRKKSLEVLQLHHAPEDWLQALQTDKVANSLMTDLRGDSLPLGLSFT